MPTIGINSELELGSSSKRNLCFKLIRIEFRFGREVCLKTPKSRYITWP